jgi:RNA polymerase sigma-70 factor (ECF subfamily)
MRVIVEGPRTREDGDLAQGFADLMSRYYGGDMAAFRSLYADLAPRVLEYLVGLTGEKQAAEDLLQQTFVKVHQSRFSYVRGANPTPLIYAIAHRTCLDRLHGRVRCERA